MTMERTVIPVIKMIAYEGLGGTALTFLKQRLEGKANDIAHHIDGKGQPMTGTI
jgi:hypothetical protein